MGRKVAPANPRQIRSKRCGCKLCLAQYPGTRPRTKDCIGSWQARYTPPGQRERAVNFPTDTEAIAFLERTRTEIRERRWIDPARGEITLTKWHALWWASQTAQLEENTIDRDGRSWRNHVEKRFGTVRLVDITWLDVQNWVNSIWDGAGGSLAASSVTKAFQVLDRMMTAALRDRRIPFNPCDGIKLPSGKGKHPDDRRPPTNDQLALVRAKLPDYLRPVQQLAEETGLRFGELAGLRWCRVDFASRRLQVREVLIEPRGHVKRKAYPKSDAGLRTVPLTDTAVQLLRELWAAEPDASRAVSEPEDGLRTEELVFHGRNEIRRGSKKADGTGERYRAPLRRSSVRRRWVDAIDKAGVARTVVKTWTEEVEDPATGRPKKVERKRTDWWPDFHDQRHTFASRLHALGVPEAITQEILGHERAGEVTWLYTHASADYAGQVLAALEGASPDQAQLRMVTGESGRVRDESGPTVSRVGVA
ncbi:site-specific integrase [Streptomyces brasiliscabiei]|uniref:site-specific integrase n=1 Tax=Streptomyces brasiliscabiei TaxID=2736302 RepID=UPI001C0F9032|nr:tyrosine-type recombinase/integrase [Streptomyces brasiliscabiei]